MRIYQSTDGSYIATDDKGLKVRGETEEDARAAFYAAGGQDEVKRDEVRTEPRRRPQ